MLLCECKFWWEGLGGSGGRSRTEIKEKTFSLASATNRFTFLSWAILIWYLSCEHDLCTTTGLGLFDIHGYFPPPIRQMHRILYFRLELISQHSNNKKQCKRKTFDIAIATILRFNFFVRRIFGWNFDVWCIEKKVGAEDTEGPALQTFAHDIAARLLVRPVPLNIDTGCTLALRCDCAAIRLEAQEQSTFV